MDRKLTINLANMFGTSLLTVGPAGYTEAISSIFQITQSRVFKLNPDDNKTKSQITHVTFPPTSHTSCGVLF